MSCVVWQQNECQKVDLTVLDISSSIIRKVGKAKHSNEYFYLAIVFALILAFIPGIYRLQSNGPSSNGTVDQSSKPQVYGPMNEPQDSPSFLMAENLLNFHNIPFPELAVIVESMIAPSSSWLICHIIIVAILQRFCLNMCFFFLLCVAERTFKEVNILTCHVGFDNVLLSTEIHVFQILLSFNFGTKSSTFRLAALQTEQSSEHQDLALCSLIPEETWTTKIS